MCKRAARHGRVNLGREIGEPKWGKNRGKGNGVWSLARARSCRGRTFLVDPRISSWLLMVAGQLGFNGKGF